MCELIIENYFSKAHILILQGDYCLEVSRLKKPFYIEINQKNLICYFLPYEFIILIYSLSDK